MELDYKAIGKRIKIARIRADITQEKLAETVNLSTSHMSNIETASTKVSLPALVCVANALNVSVDELLCDNIFHSKHCFTEEISYMLEGCDDYEIRIVTDIVRATLDAIRRDAKLRSGK